MPLYISGESQRHCLPSQSCTLLEEEEEGKGKKRKGVSVSIGRFCFQKKVCLAQRKSLKKDSLLWLWPCMDVSLPLSLSHYYSPCLLRLQSNKQSKVPQSFIIPSCSKKGGEINVFTLKNCIREDWKLLRQWLKCEETSNPFSSGGILGKVLEITNQRAKSVRQ